MTHDHERARDVTTTAAAAGVDAAPGRGSRTDHLVGPSGPRPSGLLMRKAARDDSHVAADAEAAVGAAATSTGSALPDDLRTRFEGSLGTDLSSVRVHTGAASVDAASAVGAQAYTLGNDIHFGGGHFDPSSSQGEHLLAHEVAHTVQQRGGSPTRQHKLEVSAPGDHLEHEADRAADSMVRGGAAVVGQVGGAPIQRKKDLDDPGPDRREATLESAPPVDGGKVLLGKGYFGAKVKDLTKQLKRAGFDVAVDVNYGPSVEKAVKKLQEQSGIKQTGKYDEATKDALDKLAPIMKGPATMEPHPPHLDELIAGNYRDKGDYKDTNDGFVDGDLDGLLKQYGTFWAIDVSAPPAPEAAPTDDKKPAPTGGDSSGKNVGAYPKWVGQMQAQLVEEDQWGGDQAATQKLLQAFMTAFTKHTAGKVHSSVEAFYGQVGKSEQNNQAGGVFNAPKGSADWCAQASSMMLVTGLYKHGIRFKTTHSKIAIVELSMQAAKLGEWLKKAKDNVVQEPASYTAPLEPGDIISIINGGPLGPLSGHVATVVEEVDGKIRIVSGNAGGGGGSARSEEVTRQTPPAEYPGWAVMSAVFNASHGADKAAGAEIKAYTDVPKAPVDKMGAAVDKAFDATAARDAADHKAEDASKLHPEIPTSRTDSKFKPGIHAPKNQGESWVVSIMKTSKLDANVLVGLSDDALAKQGLEKCDPLDKAFPDFAKQT